MTNDNSEPAGALQGHSLHHPGQSPHTINLSQLKGRKDYLPNYKTYEGVFKSFRTGRLERELQTVELSATR
jgi:hypothetical protein